MSRKLTKRRIFDIIQIGNKEDLPSKSFDIFISATIIINIIVMFLKTFDEASPILSILNFLEIITMIFFCIEYALRIWTATYLYPNKSEFKSILRFVISYDGIIDLLTILPFFFLSGFVVFRMLRVVRIFHLFRLNAQYDSFNVITNVLKDKKNQLISSIFVILILMLSASIGMYSAEHPAQPEVFKNAFSGFWWALATISTIGYGDIFPITTLGKIMAGIFTFAGIGVIAIPSGIISAGFVEQYTNMKNIVDEHNLNFITIHINNSSPWKGLKIKDLKLHKGIIISLIIRGDEDIVPNGDLILQTNDKLILTGEGCAEISMHLSDIRITNNHEWIGKQIKDLDISRKILLISIKRNGNNIVPNGNTVIKKNDIIIICKKD